MRKVWTITVDIQDNPHTANDDNIEEMEYWSDVIETAVQSVEYAYNKLVRMADGRLDYKPIDFTNISVMRT